MSPLLNRFKPDYTIGYGRAFLHLYRHLAELGKTVPSPKSLIHYGENLPPPDRIRLEEIYRTRAYEFYSHREDTVIGADPEPGLKYLMEDFSIPRSWIIADSSSKHWRKEVRANGR